MKYRVRVDLSFESENDARFLMNSVKGASSQAVSLNTGLASEDVAF